MRKTSWYEFILPQLLTLITGKQRGKFEIKWSKSWVYNLFRVYQIFFWREIGIRPEAMTSAKKIKGEIVIYREFYTVEALLVHAEGVVRDFFTKPKFAFRFVPVYELQLAGFAQSRLPRIFCFAIAFDVLSRNSTGDGDTNLTVSHTVTGTDPIFFGCFFVQNASNTMTAASYNSVSLTELVFEVGSVAANTVAVWGLGNPATGANTFSGTRSSSSGGFAINGVSYSGAHPTGIPDATGVYDNSSTTSAALAITSVADNCWQIGMYRNDQAAFSSVTNGTGRGSFTSQSDGVADDGPISPAGSNTVTANWTGSGLGLACGVTFKPKSADVATIRNLMSLGVGK